MDGMPTPKELARSVYIYRYMLKYAHTVRIHVYVYGYIFFYVLRTRQQGMLHVMWSKMASAPGAVHGVGPRLMLQAPGPPVRPMGWAPRL